MSDLLEHLNHNPDVTEAQVLQYLAERSEWGVQTAGTVMPVADFWRAEDLAHYHAAAAWWPRNAPKQLMRPYLGLLCNRIVTHPPLTPVTFYQELVFQSQRASAWVESEGGNAANPNETPDERKRRKGREAVARHRAVANSPDPRVTEVKRCHARYIEACRARKLAYEDHTPLVEAAKAAWEAAKADAQNST